MSPALKDTHETCIKQTLTYNKYAFGSDWFPVNQVTTSPVRDCAISPAVIYKTFVRLKVYK